MSDPNQVRTIGEILSEASQQGPAKGIVSVAPQSMQIGPVGPYGQSCLVCQHQIFEKDCPTHSNSEEYVWFAGFSPAGYYHRRCLDRRLAERAQQLRQQYGNPQVQEARQR